MSALPRAPLALGLPRATRLYRAYVLEQLEAMPTVDLDVALATLWRRIDALNRPLPVVTRAKDAADWMRRSLAACALVAALPPLPEATAAQRRVMAWKAERQAQNLDAEADSWAAEAEAAQEQRREDHVRDCDDRLTLTFTAAESFLDRPEEF